MSQEKESKEKLVARKRFLLRKQEEAEAEEAIKTYKGKDENSPIRSEPTKNVRDH